MSDWLNLFVPGRLCLFGEHSDWAGAYLQFRETPGYCIAVGTNQGIRCALGSLNQEITAQAKQALIAGNVEKIGELMREAQEIFDRLIAPASPKELLAPKLHNLLNYAPIQNLIWGGKGVGSQGDGTAQLLTRSDEARTLAQTIIEKDLGLPCLNLTLQTKEKQPPL